MFFSVFLQILQNLAIKPFVSFSRSLVSHDCSCISSQNCTGLCYCWFISVSLQPSILTMLCAKNDDAGLVPPRLYALGIIPFATLVNSKDIIAREFKQDQQDQKRSFPILLINQKRQWWSRGKNRRLKFILHTCNLENQEFESHLPLVVSGWEKNSRKSVTWSAVPYAPLSVS